VAINHGPTALFRCPKWRPSAEIVGNHLNERGKRSLTVAISTEFLSFKTLVIAARKTQFGTQTRPSLTGSFPFSSKTQQTDGFLFVNPFITNVIIAPVVIVKQLHTHTHRCSRSMN
jgi:hypothetical protein